MKGNLLYKGKEYIYKTQIYQERVVFNIFFDVLAIKVKEDKFLGRKFKFELCKYIDKNCNWNYEYFEGKDLEYFSIASEEKINEIIKEAIIQEIDKYDNKNLEHNEYRILKKKLKEKYR